MDRLMGSKALAAEVRILLQEVGKLRDEKRALQFEVSELLAAKVSPRLSILSTCIADIYPRLDTARMVTTIQNGAYPKPLNRPIFIH
ncbi:hypothetical protein M408DRAFT_331470 [Serendipita vermifera MAFF 305830]|uniref:Uncharacterized protein n=1 Tax=Serendipita vermifera MAFF 305830 TaxID=933852 RepID=A0A0C2X6S4_SERVB|nr:hypothetical protein M408DRAFT_331470 [Serendipita vermifera MAFF 305830]